MKILFITHNGSMYGANRSLLALILELRQYKIIPVIFCPQKGDFTEKLAAEGIEYYVKRFDDWIYIKKLGFLKLPLILFRNLLFFIRNYKVIKSIKAELVYSNSSVVSMGAIIKLLYKIPHIWHIREFGRIDYNIKFHFGLKGRRYLYNKANAVIAISNSVFNVVLNKVTTPTSIIYNGVVAENTLSGSVNRSIENKVTINFAIVGALAPYKNHNDAIIAFHQYHKLNPKSTLLIIGDTNDKPFRDQLITTVNQLNLQKAVKFMGFIPDVDQIYEQIDVLLMCSKNEGMGRVTVEAMAKGIPVIGYDGGATPELIKHGFNGLLYESDFHDLAEKMNHLINTENLYEDISANAIAQIKAKFTIEAYTENVFKVIQKVMESSLSDN